MMLTSEQLSNLATQAGQVGAAKDASAAGELLAILLGAEDSEFAQLDLNDLKNVMQIAALIAELADNQLIGHLFVRVINAMRAFDVTPAAAEFILPLYNLRASYIISGATENASKMLSQIVDAARHADTVPRTTMRVLTELMSAFESSGYTEAAVVLYRPVCATIVADSQIDWPSKLQVVARLGRLQLADGQPDDAMQTYEQVLTTLDNIELDPAGEIDSTRMMLWYLIADARSQTDDVEGAEQAYEMAMSIVEDSANPESAEAGVLFHNLAGFWFSKNRRDRYPEAIALTQRALAIAERLGRKETPEYAAGLGQIANLKAGLGEIAEAQQYFDACFEAFATADDTNASDVADYRHDEGTFLLETEQAPRAVASFDAAREIRQVIPGFPSNELADTYCWIAVAHFENDHFADASEVFRRALDLRMEQSPRVATTPGDSP